MSGMAKYFIVEASAMPEIYRKVAQAKRLLVTILSLPDSF